VAGTVVLLLVLVGAFAFSRYKAGKSWFERAKRRSGASVERETDGITWSQSMQGRTVFTLHAAKAFQHADGLWTLHDVVITLYGLKDARADRVYGKDFEWDETKGIARAIGDVQMDLQVPAGVATSERAGGAANGDGASGEAARIHVRTSGLVFLRKLGVAATQEQIEFRYGGLTCVAQGAEFDNSPSSLHLLANVRVNGEMQGKPVAMTANKADFDRSTNVVSLLQPVAAAGERKGRAANAVLHLRKDGSVERAEATGGVEMEEGARHLGAARVDAVLSGKNQMQSAVFSGGVRLVDDTAERPVRGEAGEVRMRFDAQGQPVEIAALHQAHLSAPDKGKTGVLQREMRGEQILATLVSAGARTGKKGRTELRQIHVSGVASIVGESDAGAGGGVKATSVAADDLLIKFAAQGGQAMAVESLHGQGHTVLRQTAPLGAERVSSGEALDVAFEATGSKGDPKAPGKMQIATAVQQGHVTITDRAAIKPAASNSAASVKPPAVTTGNADRAAYDGRTERLTLSGGAHAVEGGTSLAAERVVLNQASGDAEADGNVVATMAGTVATAQATHVMSAHAVLHNASQTAEFTGAPGKPARMWQEASQIEAASLWMDRQKHTLTARPATAGGMVHAVFAAAETGKHPAGNGPGAAPSIVRVESRQMDYAEAVRQATFPGPVKIDGATGEVRAQRATVFFAQPAGQGAPKRGADEMGLPSGSVDRVVISGDVKMEQPGRQGTGEQLVYKAADGSFVLTGTAAVPPRITDQVQGTVTGASLLFRSGDSTIVVSGAAPGTPHQRTRTETHVRQ
jgi:lipopolysaccharide export system protein LptA